MELGLARRSRARPPEINRERYEYIARQARGGAFGVRALPASAST